MPEQNVSIKNRTIPSVCHSATAGSAYGSYGIVTSTVIWKPGFRVWCSLQLIVHAPVTAPALSGMLLTAITVNEHKSAVSAACLRFMPQSLPQHCLGCCLRRLRLMGTQVCGVRGVSTVHAPVTAPALSGMLLTAITVNGTQVCGVRGVSTIRAPVTSPALFGMLLTALTVNGTQVCGVRGVSTVHVQVTTPALSGMLLTAITVNGTQVCGVRGVSTVHVTVTAPTLSLALTVTGKLSLTPTRYSEA